MMSYRAMKHWPRPQSLTLAVIALTFASGAADVACFTRLGGVFASVMTGNIVLWGLAAARGSATLASHTTVSIAGYITGVACGTWIGHGVKTAALAVKGADSESDADPAAASAAGSSAAGSSAAGSDAAGDGGVVPSHVLGVLLGELTLLAGFTVGWEVSGARP